MIFEKKLLKVKNRIFCHKHLPLINSNNDLKYVKQLRNLWKQNKIKNILGLEKPVRLPLNNILFSMTQMTPEISANSNILGLAKLKILGIF